MTETLLALLAGHFLGDFALQTERMIRRKRQLRVMLLHVAIVTAVTALFLGSLHWPLLLILFATHLAMDTLKIHALRPTAGAFLLDQAVHLAVIIALAALLPTAAASGVWTSWLPAPAYQTYQQALVLLVTFLAAVPAGGILIGHLLQPVTAELDDERNPGGGLVNGGRYIGWLERALTVLLYLSGQAAAVGFVIATKSLLRFGEIRDSRHRKLAEYIIIGTFLSFTWALVWAVLAENALDAVAAGR